jgi:formate-dependent nitrite reductase cytochrome c552 subunit
MLDLSEEMSTMSRTERFFVALMFALAVAGVTLVIAQAQTAGNIQPQYQQPSDCAACHSQFHDSWLAGAHGRAGQDPAFLQAWNEQGKPGACLVCHVTGYDPATATWRVDGIACEACHSPIPANHPGEPVPIDRTPDLCGTCHSDTRFGWQDWRVSAHYQRHMTCTVCHDPHSAGLKTIPPSEGELAFEDASQLCITCHRTYSMDFTFSSHFQNGVSCIDCHLRHPELGEREAHTTPDHSFHASLATCNLCHASQMHGPTEPPAERTESAPGVTTHAGVISPSTTTPAVVSEPRPVSPLGFAGLAGLLGLAAGMVLSPWLERLYWKVNRKTEGDE